MKIILKILAFVCGVLATICLGAFYYFIHTGQPSPALMSYALALACALMVMLFGHVGSSVGG